MTMKPAIWPASYPKIRPPRETRRPIMNTRHVRYGCLEPLLSLSAAGWDSTAVMSVDMLVFLALLLFVVSFFLISVLPLP